MVAQKCTSECVGGFKNFEKQFSNMPENFSNFHNFGFKISTPLIFILNRKIDSDFYIFNSYNSTNLGIGEVTKSQRTKNTQSRVYIILVKSE